MTATLRPAAATMAGVLAALACGVTLRVFAGAPAQVVVLAVVLTVTLRRVPAATTLRGFATAAGELVLVALAAGGAGALLFHDLWLGGPLLVAGLSVGILARRYGPAVRSAGRLIGLPFVALLTTPAVGPPPSLLWGPVAALVALACSSLTKPATDAPAPSPVTRKRWDAPSRMALQMACGTGAAMVVGVLVLGDEWPWAVLSAFLVQSGNRGRGDVVHKAALRVAGGLAGTLVASLLAGLVPTGHRVVLVALFVVMFAGLVLRERSYAWWAAAVTAMVALLHSYYGGTGTGVLADRLLGVALGAVVGVLAAWFVMPVRTADVVRRRLFDALAALTDDLGDASGSRYAGSLARLDELVPTLRAHRTTLRRRDRVHAHDAVRALHELELPTDDGPRRELRAATVWVRRSAAGRDVSGAPELPTELETVHAVLARHR